MKLYLYIVFGICFLFVSCKKDTTVKKTEVVDDSKLIIGNNSDINLISYNTNVISPSYNQLESLNIDINGDNVSDFKFTSYIDAYMGGTQLIDEAKILCLNPNSLICGIIKTDSTFLHRYTTVSALTNNSITVNNYNNYLCNRMSSNDSIISIKPNQFKILPKNNGDALKKSEIFFCDTVLIGFDNSFSTGFAPQILHQDTIFNTITSYNGYCGSLIPQNTVFYIGVKIKGWQSEKLGWIKLSVNDKFKISLIESAIQK